MMLLCIECDVWLCYIDEIGRDCCLIECLALSDCKLATSHQCRRAPIECATGICVSLILYYSQFNAASKSNVVLL